MPTIAEAFAAAREHHQAGRLQMAEQIYRQILQADPNCHPAWFSLGVLAFQVGQHAPAAEFLGKAVALVPDNFEYHKNLGIVLAQLGRLGDAEACLRRATELDPNDDAAHAMLRQIVRLKVYPLQIPPLRVQANLDFLLLELPQRGELLMPNGLAHVHNTLLKTGVRFQTLDANIILYHRYHQKRILEKRLPVTPSGYTLPENPWANTSNLEWEKPEVLDYFWSDLGDLVSQIVATRPKAVGISIHATNRPVARRFVRELRALAPEVAIVVGGYDCIYREIGPRLFPDFDYMVIFESELTIGPLVTALARGERPGDLPGIVSRHDSPLRIWQPGPLLEDLDQVDYPRYQWIPLDLYRTFNGHIQAPISASRGCAWGRCRFCQERLPFRRRSPLRVADEIQELNHRGVDSFHFNESDVNGDPQMLHDVCSEIICRGLNVQMAGQLRIDKRNTAEYFQHLRRAGFNYLRFGVDGWSDHVLNLQCKGYNMALVTQNLRDCHAAGIFTAVNIVVGVPGETDEDVEESIGNMIRSKDYYHTVNSINPLNLLGQSEYCENPDKYKIRFREDFAAIRRQHPYTIPSDSWYSEDPYIDFPVRLQRLERVGNALTANRIRVEPFSLNVIEQLKQPGAYIAGDGEVRRAAGVPAPGNVLA